MSKTQEIFLYANPYATDFQGDYVRALFVCSAGILRSPTAAAIACNMGWNTRSCGTLTNALIPLTESLIAWADKIYFMDSESFEVATTRFNANLNTTPDWILTALETKSTVWNIPDEYNYMDATLVNQIQQLFA